MREIVSGMMVSMYLVGALYFLKFWKKSGDVLFAFFSLAFLILSAQRLMLGANEDQFRESPSFYLARLAAFVLIIVAILNKNRPKKP